MYDPEWLREQALRSHSNRRTVLTPSQTGRNGANSYPVSRERSDVGGDKTPLYLLNAVDGKPLVV
jgi:hypothetical protein